jgi:hypothetical protein
LDDSRVTFPHEAFACDAWLTGGPIAGVAARPAVLRMSHQVDLTAVVRIAIAVGKAWKAVQLAYPFATCTCLLRSATRAEAPARSARVGIVQEVATPGCAERLSVACARDGALGAVALVDTQLTLRRIAHDPAAAAVVRVSAEIGYLAAVADALRISEIVIAVASCSNAFRLATNAIYASVIAAIREAARTVVAIADSAAPSAIPVVDLRIDAPAFARDLARRAPAYPFAARLAVGARVPARTAVLHVGEDVDFASIVDRGIAVAPVLPTQNERAPAFELAAAIDAPRDHVDGRVRGALVVAGAAMVAIALEVRSALVRGAGAGLARRETLGARRSNACEKPRRRLGRGVTAVGGRTEARLRVIGARSCTEGEEFVARRARDDGGHGEHCRERHAKPTASDVLVS